MKAYGMPKHRHLSEIEEQLEKAAFADASSNLIHLAPMSRGISTIVAKSKASLEASTLDGQKHMQKNHSSLFCQRNIS